MSPERNHADSETEDTSEGDGTTVTDDKSEAEKKDETQHEQVSPDGQYERGCGQDPDRNGPRSKHA